MKQYLKPFSFFLVLIIILTQCSAFSYDSINEISIPDDDPVLLGIINRAIQIATISWIPKKQIPNNIDFYEENKAVIGIPYSSVKEKDKFVGQEVSFLTFMTAVHNPRSVLYTENVSKPPYVGNNCSCYYGTVCSMAVNYALGISLPIETDMYEQSALFDFVENQSIYGAKRFDILLSKGHVVMILDIKKDREHNINNIIILESSSTGTEFKHYSIESFLKRWAEDKWTLLRYKNLNSQQDFSPLLPDIHEINYSTYKYNNHICTSRGDYVTYREGESIVINVLSSEFQHVELYKDDILFSIKRINEMDIQYDDLPCGIYKARLTSKYANSDFVHFEILDAAVMIEASKVYITSKTSKPEYLVACNQRGERFYVALLHNSEISIYDILKSCANCKEIYIKVFFKGKYGRVSNEPIKI